MQPMSHEQTFADALNEQGIETTRNDNTSKTYEKKNGVETHTFKNDTGSIRMQGKNGQTDSIKITEKDPVMPGAGAGTDDKLTKLKQLAGLFKKKEFVAPERNLSNLDMTPWARHVDALYGTNTAATMKDPYQVELRNAIERYKMQEDPLLRAGMAADLQGKMTRNEGAEATNKGALIRNEANQLKLDEFKNTKDLRMRLKKLPLSQQYQLQKERDRNYKLKLRRLKGIEGKNASEKATKIADGYNKTLRDVSSGKYLSPGDKKYVDTFMGKIAGAEHVRTQLKASLGQYRKTKDSDQKVVLGRSMLKLLNSVLGADAIAQHEQAMHGIFLEFQVGNLFEPGRFVGRDLKGFDKQVQSIIEGLNQGNTLAKQEMNEYVRNNSAVPMGPDGTFPAPNEIPAQPAASGGGGGGGEAPLTDEEEAEYQKLLNIGE